MKGKLNVFISLGLSTLVLSSCASLGKMKKNADKVSYTVTPEVLETHGGEVDVKIKASFPEKYFAKKVTVTATPVIKYDGGEVALDSYVVQGEKVQDNNKKIQYKAGGNYTYTGKAPYKKDMRISDLEIRITGKQGNKTVDFDPIKVADGVVSTPTLVSNEAAASVLGKDQFQRIIPEAETADIHFLIQQFNLRGSELKADDIKALKDYIRLVNATQNKEFRGVEVSSYASPDGPTDLNTRLSKNRGNVSERYIKRELRKAKVNEAKDAEFVEATNTPEDWEGFKELMETSTIQDKELILRVLSMYSDPEVREREIKNLSAAYKVLADDILPQLRRSKMTVNVDLIGKTDEEIAKLVDSDPAGLNAEEMLYAATLTNDQNKQLEIYKKAASQFPQDWRGSNDMGYIYFQQGKFAEAKKSFEKANSIKANEPIVNNNLGIIALVDGDVAKAESYFGNAAGTGTALDYNMGIVNIHKGNYKAAVKSFSDCKCNNAALAKILAGNNSAALATLNSVEKPCGMTHYLKAVIGARTSDKALVMSSLKAAVAADASLKTVAATDIEFAKFFEDSEFTSIVK